MTQKSIILACSGPSLRAVDVESTRIPIAAVSTAIRCFERPEFWIFVDRPNPHYGSDRGNKYLNDPAIKKVTQEKLRNKMPAYPNLHFVGYNSNGEDEGRSFMDGKAKLLRTCHRSSLFAVQWLIRQGFTRLIFAGVDLKTDPEDPYAYDATLAPNVAREFNSQHLKELDYLRQWTPQAAMNGITFLSWSPGSPINEFMPAFDPKEVSCRT